MIDIIQKGVKYMNFKDSYGQKCIFKKEGKLLKLGVKNTGKSLKNKEINKYMYLSKEVFNKIEPALSAFLSGSESWLEAIGAEYAHQFQDAHNQTCILQNSSFADDLRMWWGVESARIHFSFDELSDIYDEAFDFFDEQD